MFLILVTVLLPDVDHWECLSDDTVALLLRFDGWWLMNRDGNGRWMGRGFRRRLHVPMVRIRFAKKKKTFSA